MSMNWVKLASRAGAAAAAGVAGFASYRHIVKVAHGFGESFEVAAVLPLSIDGLIVVGTMAMIEDKRAGRRPRLSARVALGFGVVATLASNIASAQPSLGARLMAAVPAISFLIAVEVLARTGKPVADTLSDTEPVDVDEPVQDEPADPWLHAVPIGPLPAPQRVDKVSDSKRATRKRPPSSRDRVISAHNRTPDATHEELAARLRVSVKTIERYRPAKLSDNLSDSESKPINGHAVPELVSEGG